LDATVGKVAANVWRHNTATLPQRNALLNGTLDKPQSSSEAEGEQKNILTFLENTSVVQPLVNH